MENPKYLVNIYYSNPVRTGSTGATSPSGLWETSPVYSSGYFVASMPEVRISATGSTYTGALTALLLIATASTTYDAAQGPLKNY
jgi:hypothetical protein